MSSAERPRKSYAGKFGSITSEPKPGTVLLFQNTRSFRLSLAPSVALGGVSYFTQFPVKLDNAYSVTYSIPDHLPALRALIHRSVLYRLSSAQH